MGRIEYADWDEPDWGLKAGRQLARHKAALSGQRGQQALVELREALLEMPLKELVAEELYNNNGGACALGVLALKRGVRPEEMLALDPSILEDWYKIADWAAKRINVSHTLALVIQEVNDNECIYASYTPNMRYEEVLSWVNKWIQNPAIAYERYKNSILP